MSRHGARWWALAAAVALGTAACGGPSTAGVATVGTTTTSVPGGGPPNSGSFVAYARCLRSHGIPNFPDDPASPAVAAALKSFKSGGPTVRAATQACRKFAPAGGTGAQISPKDQADYLKAARCMRSHGIAGFPDPVLSPGNVRFPVPSSMNTHSTQFEQARQICAKLIPAGLPYSSSSG
jgi:hypothetical protein